MAIHPLIPAVSQSALSLLAWLSNTLTPAALLAGFLLAASQSRHHWPAWFGLFALVFSTATLLPLLTRSSRTVRPPTGTAAFLLANLVLIAALVPLHELYLQNRMWGLRWFLILRAPNGCLPVPSRTYEFPEGGRWVLKDALANQLPFAILASYAVALANIFSVSVGGRGPTGRVNGKGFIAGGVGALVLAVAAAQLLPVCDESHTDTGALEVMQHVDRSTYHNERMPLTWSWEARYPRLIAAVTAAGTAGLLVQPVLRGNGARGSHVATFLSHLLVASGVLLGMAIWSFYL